MVVQLVHRAQLRLALEAGQIPRHRALEGPAVPEKLRMEAVAVLLHACQEEGHRLHKGVVVHHRVPLAAVQPVGGFPVVLGKDHRVRIRLFHGFPELLPEGVVVLRRVAQVCGHVETPAVRIVGGRDPLFCHAQDVVDELRALLVIQLRERVVPPPAVVELVVGPGVLIRKTEEAVVRALLVHERAFFVALLPLVDPLAVHPLVEGAAVVEDAVDDDAHAALMGLRNQLREELVTGLEVFAGGHAGNVLRGMRICRVALREADWRVLDNHAEMRIDVVVILNVILVARGRDENRV